MMRTEVITEKGKREADGSVRFAAHAAGSPFDVIMEPIHNMLAYGKSKGRIQIKSKGSKVCDYIFYNNANSKKLPTYDELKTIGQKAGKSISKREGVSLCGIGTEVMALSSRPHSDSTVTAHITVVNNCLTYGLILTFNGLTKDITYEMIEPKESTSENSYEVSFNNCKAMTDSEITLLKKRIADTMYGKNFEIKFITEDEICTITPCDFLYRSELVNTDNYEKHVFTIKGTKETLILEISDVYDIVRNRKGNEYEFATQCSPELSGGTFRYKNIATVCRGDMGWKTSGAYKKAHPTYNNIRYDFTIGDYVFNELHKESQVKTETNISLTELKDKYRDDLTLIDKDGNELSISEIKYIITDFVNRHKTDSNSSVNINNLTSFINEALNNGSITQNDINCAIKILRLNNNVRMNVATFEDVLNTFNNKAKEICFKHAE